MLRGIDWVAVNREMAKKSFFPSSFNIYIYIYIYVIRQPGGIQFISVRCKVLLQFRPHRNGKFQYERSTVGLCSLN